MDVGTVAALVVGLLAAFVALVVFVPFRFEAVGAVEEGEVSGSARIDWGWGLLGVSVRPGEGAAFRVLGLRLPLRLLRRLRLRRSAQRKTAKRDQPSADGRRPSRGLRRLGGLAQHRSAWLEMVRRLARTLRLRLALAGVVGTGDPADDALLLAVLRVVRELPGVSADVEVDWLDDVIDLQARASGRLWLLPIAAVALGFLFRRPTRLALRAVA